MALRIALLASLLIAMLSSELPAADWPQWRGPDRADIAAETKLLKSWPAGGPPLLWVYRDAGIGYSGPAIVGDRIYLMGGRGATEYAFALDVTNGAQQWAAPIGPTFTFSGNSWGDGPRGTPTVEGGFVYALGGQGDLVCLNAVDGHELWRVSMLRDLGGEISPAGGGPERIGWGYTESLLVDGGRVICTPGGSRGAVAALARDTGKVIWRSTELTDPATYASLMPAEICGTRQYIVMTDHGAAGVAASDGRLLWRYRRKSEYPEFVIPTPIVHDAYVYTTAGSGAGCDLIRVTAESGKFKAAKVYANKTMVNQHGGVLLLDGSLFGYSDGKGWVCQVFTTGKMRWSEKRKFGRGSVTAADGHFYCYAEDDGSVALVRASADGWHEDGRFRIPEESKLHKPNGKIWTHPVVANGRLYLRDQELVFCFDLRPH